jgi:cytochrome c oxidase cbb3-type subunit 1
MENLKDGSASRMFFFSAIFWFCVGTFMGFVNGTKLAAPGFMADNPYLAFGHLRPVHVHIVIFGWISMAFAGAMCYITPALCNTRLWSEKLGVINVYLWNAGMVVLITCLTLGMTSGREYSDMPWVVDIYAALFMVIPLSINVWMTIIHRKSKGLYVTVWFFATALMMLAITFLIGQSPELFHLTGLNEAYLTWWHAHNILGLFITPVSAAIAYYTVPKATGNTLYSHRIGHLHFWSIAAFYSTPGAHHLMGAPIPEWIKSFASVAGVLVLVPAIAFCANLLLTMQGKWSMFVTNLPIKWTITGVLMAVPLNFQGGFQQTRAINWYIHGTHWIVAHAHLALLGFSTFVEVGAIYYALPKLLGRKLYSESIGNVHFWLTLIGFIIYWTSMTTAGLIQGAGKIYEVAYIETVSATQPYMVARAIGGFMVFIGQCLFLYNMYMTATAGEKTEEFNIANT